MLKDGSYPLAEGEAYGPAAATWVYTADPETDLFSGGLSGAQRMPNGNTLICQGRGGNGEGAERSPKRPSHTCGTAYKVTTVDCP